MFFVENVGADVLASMNTHASLSKKAAAPLVTRGKTKDSDNEEAGGRGEEDGYESPGASGRGAHGAELEEMGGPGGCAGGALFTRCTSSCEWTE